MAFVLCTGVHYGLVRTRKLVLEDAGHTVITALSEREIVRACEQVQFDVVVIGQSANPKVKQEYLSAVRRVCPSAKVLEVYAPNQGVILNDADDWLESPAIPTRLAGCVARLAQEKKKEQAAANP